MCKRCTILATHGHELNRMKAFGARLLLPNHGAAERIADAGYDPRFWDATSDYVESLLQMKSDSRLAQTPVRDIIAPWLANGTRTWFEGYSAVHQENPMQVLKTT